MIPMYFPIRSIFSDDDLLSLFRNYLAIQFAQERILVLDENAFVDFQATHDGNNITHLGNAVRILCSLTGQHDYFTLRKLVDRIALGYRNFAQVHLVEWISEVHGIFAAFKFEGV